LQLLRVAIATAMDGVIGCLVSSRDGLSRFHVCIKVDSYGFVTVILPHQSDRESECEFCEDVSRVQPANHSKSPLGLAIARSNHASTSA
jgi:hypothetical protein